MKCLEEVIHSSSPHDCVLSPTRLTNTACQLYFLFIGRFGDSELRFLICPQFQVEQDRDWKGLPGSTPDFAPAHILARRQARHLPQARRVLHGLQDG